MNSYLLVLFGFMAAFILPVMKDLFPHRLSEKTPAYVTKKFYWFVMFLVAVIGGALVAFNLWVGNTVTAFTAIQLGASTPFFINAFGSSSPKYD